MSVLDLQGLEMAERPKGPPAGSHGSKGCGNINGGNTKNSGLSIACDIL